MTEESTMCHDDSSRPPAPPVVGAVASSGPVELRSSDGPRVLAFEAHPAAASTRGMVILPDIRGLHAYYRDLAVRMAEAGFHAVAIDYFGRTADTEVRDETFDHMAHVQLTTPEGVAADVGAGIAHLLSPEGGSATRIFTTGFCFGGGYSWRQAAEHPELSGCIGFYGGSGTVLEVADRIEAPLLLLLAGADARIRPEHFDDLVVELERRGIEAERHVYDGAPHSFFDRSFADWQGACADSWARILAFTARHS
jgi:carboxymethylenebutenolidase